MVQRATKLKTNLYQKCDLFREPMSVTLYLLGSYGADAALRPNHISRFIIRCANHQSCCLNPLPLSCGLYVYEEPSPSHRQMWHSFMWCPWGYQNVLHTLLSCALHATYIDLQNFIRSISRPYSYLHHFLLPPGAPGTVRYLFGELLQFLEQSGLVTGLWTHCCRRESGAIWLLSFSSGFATLMSAYLLFLFNPPFFPTAVSRPSMGKQLRPPYSFLAFLTKFIRPSTERTDWSTGCSAGTMTHRHF